MYSIFEKFLPFNVPLTFSDSSLADQYSDWDKPSRQLQISLIMFLTALLYVVFGFIDKSWASDSVQVLMLKMHLFVVVPFLILIGFLAYLKRFYSLVQKLLFVFPFASMSCHAYIIGQLNDSTQFLPEGYLGVLWIFIMSGMTFKYAVTCASAVLVLLVSIGAFHLNSDQFWLHFFWVFCSYSFGFLGALIFDLSRKAIFLSQRSLQVMAETDALTGAYTRNKFKQLMANVMPRNVDNPVACGLVMLDIDDFKQINDRFGHSVGDDVLKKVTDIISENIHEQDALIRWGGEEFIVVSTHSNRDTLMSLSEKLRLCVKDEVFDKVGRVTLSIGATEVKSEDTQDSFVVRADVALYEAKAQGKNCSVFKS